MTSDGALTADSPLEQTNPAELDEYRARARTSPWLAYPVTAVKKIIPFHESMARYRVLSGPNGGGKSTGGAADFVGFPLGQHAFRDEPILTPNVSWAVCIEYNSSGRVMFRKISDMLPRHPNGKPKWKYYKQEHVFELENGSIIAIKSQKEGESSLLAERCRAIWIDEAMGGDRGLENFGELQARGLPDEPLDMIFTLTPKLDTGLAWMRNKLWCEPGQTPHEDFIPGTFCLRFDLKDCLIENGGFLTPEYVANRERTVDPDEADARLRGAWTPFYVRPAFSYKHLMEAMERAPRSRNVRWKRGGYLSFHPEDCDGGPNHLQRERESGHSYIAAWDPSSGLGRGHDLSAFVVFDRGDLGQVFHAESLDLTPDRFFEEIVLPASTHYNDALLVIEENGQSGGAAIGALKASGYNNFYMRKRINSLSGTPSHSIGWSTNDQTRGRMIDSLQRALQERKWTPSRDLIDQMGHVVKKPQPSGKIRIEHDDGFHDDLVMASGIALAVHYEEPVYEWPSWSSLAVRYGPRHEVIEILGA